MLDKRTRKPLIVPFFIPFQGCRHRCVYCEQEKITNQPVRAPSRGEITDLLERTVNGRSQRVPTDREIAFYGGTFTGLSYKMMGEMLDGVAPYLRAGFFSSIRVSTRPDAVDEQKLRFLKERGVSTVELGAQSMSDEVLSLSKRGHTAEETRRAVLLLKQHQFRVGIQLMPGLPGDSEEVFLDSVREVVELDVDMVRLYPTVVLRGTELARWHEEGKYRPLRLDEAVTICKKSCVLLEGRGIPVIRMGLIASPQLREEGQVLAGPWHDAFGHLVRSEIYFDRIEPQLPRAGEARRIKLLVPPREIALLRGFKNMGLYRLQERVGARVQEIIPDPSLPSGLVKVESV